MKNHALVLMVAGTLVACGIIDPDSPSQGAEARPSGTKDADKGLAVTAELVKHPSGGLAATVTVTNHGADTLRGEAGGCDMRWRVYAESAGDLVWRTEDDWPTCPLIGRYLNLGPGDQRTWWEPVSEDLLHVLPSGTYRVEGIYEISAPTRRFGPFGFGTISVP